MGASSISDIGKLSTLPKTGSREVSLIGQNFSSLATYLTIILELREENLLGFSGSEFWKRVIASSSTSLDMIVAKLKQNDMHRNINSFRPSATEGVKSLINFGHTEIRMSSKFWKLAGGIVPLHIFVSSGRYVKEITAKLGSMFCSGLRSSKWNTSAS